MSAGWKVALSATSGCAGLVLLAIGGVVSAIGSCSSEFGRDAVEHDTGSGTGTIAGWGIQGLGFGTEAIGIGLLSLGLVFGVIGVVAFLGLISRPSPPAPQDGWAHRK